MIPYLIFTLVILACHHFRRSSLMLAAMLVFACIRYDVGWDYMFYFNSAVGNPSENRFAIHAGAFWMPLFELSNKLGTPWLTVSLVNAATYLAFYYGLKMIVADSKHLCDAMLVYALWPLLFLESLSTLRQSLAISLIFLAVGLIIRHRKAVAIIVIAANLFVHNTSIAVWPVYWLFLYKKSLNWRSTLILTATFMAAVISVKYWGGLTGVLSLQNYARYFTPTDTYGWKLLVMACTFIAITAFALHRNGTEMSRQLKNFTYLTLAGFLCLSIMIVMRLSPPVWRVTAYYTAFLAISLCPAVATLKLKLANVALATCLAIVFIAHLWNGTRGNETTSSPYVPYRTLFSYYNTGEDESPDDSDTTTATFSTEI